MLQEQADLDGARAAFEAGVAMGDPTSMRLLTSMGYTVVASDEGVSSTAGTTSDMVVTMAQQAYHAGALSPQAYEKDLRGVIDRDRGSAGDLARAALARLLEERGDWAAAEQLYREVVDGDHAGQPFHAASALNLGNLLLGQQRLEEGEAMLKVAVATGDLEASAKAAFTLAPVLMRQGRMEEGKAALQAAIDCGHPQDSPAAQLWRGKLLVGERAFVAARQDLDAVVRSGNPALAAEAKMFLATVLPTMEDTLGGADQPTEPKPKGWWARLRGGRA